MKAILYSRWSSQEQTGTTSAPRQLALTERFAVNNGWEIVERLTDEGRSAWTGDNLRTGQLGQLLARLEREGADDHVLVVEKLDRLSRQPPLIMAAWVQRACAAGLTIATADGAHRINNEKLQRDQMTVLAMVFESFRGFAESQAKSERVADAWARKRERGMPMTRISPGWLTIDAGVTAYRSPANTSASYTVVPERADLVRRIFALTDAGVGKATIARRFNQEGILPWGRGRGWHASYVQKIIRNPAVIGEFQPHTYPKAGVRRPAGEPIADYFPAVVPVDLFERVNSPRQSRVHANQSANPLINLLSGQTRCASCQGPMTLINKGDETRADGTVVPRRYFKCSAAHRSMGCKMRIAFPHEIVEDAILDNLLHLAMDAQSFSRAPDAPTLESALLIAKRELAQAERLQEVAYDLVEEVATDALAMDKYRQRRAEVAEAKQRVQRHADELAGTVSKTSPQEHVARVAEVRQLMTSDDEAQRYEARRRIKLALNDLVEVVIFSGRKKRFTVSLAGGVRVLAFDGAGNKGLDVDWLEIDCFEPRIDNGPATDAAIAAYARRGSKVKFRPVHPTAFCMMLGHLAGWPGTGDQFRNEHEAHDWRKKLDVAYEEFVDTTKKLLNLLDRSGDYHILAMEYAGRTSEDVDKSYKLFISLEVVLRSVAELPKPRPLVPPNGRSRQDAYAQEIVRAVLWYLLREERLDEKPMTSKDGTYPTNKPAVLAELVLLACGVTLSGKLGSVLGTVYKETKWRSPAFNYWDLLPKRTRPSPP